MRQLRLLWLPLLAIALVLIGCQPVMPVEEAAQAEPALVTYADENGYFTVDYPAGWVAIPYLFDDTPLPHVAIGSNQEIIDLSEAYEPLPEDEIGVAIILMPRDLLAEAGITPESPLDEIIMAMMVGMADDPEEMMGFFGETTPELYTLRNGAPAVRAAFDAPTESYLATLVDLGDGLLLFAPQIQAVGYHNTALEAQIVAIIESFELTASADEVMAYTMSQMEAMGAGAEPAASGEAAPTVTFSATEYAYDGPAEIPGGLTRIEFANTGELEHSLWFVKLDEGRTVEDFLGLMASIETDPQLPDWFAFYGGLTALPGQTLAYTIDFAPGSYAYFSFSGMESEEPDVAKGMVGTLTVTEAPAAAAVPPAADLRAELVDFSFIIDGTPVAGRQVVEVANTGSEPHELILLRLAEGVTMQDALEAMMSGEPPEGEPPAMFVGGAAPMAAGLTAWYEVELEPGSYGIICFIPSIANEGAPHFMLGMVQQVNVAAASN